VVWQWDLLRCVERVPGLSRWGQQTSQNLPEKMGSRGSWPIARAPSQALDSILRARESAPQVRLARGFGRDNRGATIPAEAAHEGGNTKIRRQIAKATGEPRTRHRSSGNGVSQADDGPCGDVKRRYRRRELEWRQNTLNLVLNHLFRARNPNLVKPPSPSNFLHPLHSNRKIKSEPMSHFPCATCHT